MRINPFRRIPSDPGLQDPQGSPQGRRSLCGPGHRARTAVDEQVADSSVWSSRASIVRGCGIDALQDARRLPWRLIIAGTTPTLKEGRMLPATPEEVFNDEARQAGRRPSQ